MIVLLARSGGPRWTPSASDGPVATITAGWQEREPDDAELDALLDGRSVNLRPATPAGRTCWSATRSTPPPSASTGAALAELQELHLVQLDGVLGALREVARRGGGGPRVREAARADAEAVGPARRRAAPGAGWPRSAPRSTARWRPAERSAVAAHREAVGRVLAGAAALVVAGGHVGVLGHVLRLFAVTRRPGRRSSSPGRRGRWR